MAVIYAVGVGPGDPELLTRKAERIISSAGVICAPTGAADAASYALSIVEHLLDRSRQEILTRVFPMMKKGPELEAAWEEVATDVITRIDRGEDVAFITIGDPCLYSTFLYIYRIIRKKRADITIEIIPVRGKWTEESGYQAITSRLQLHGSTAPTVQIIGCQNDAMAMGARRAVETLTSGANRDRWLQIPFTGVDGVPTSGQVWVQNKLLAGTVITPALTGLALELLIKTLSTGAPMPERTLTRPISYPTIEELSARGGAAVPAR